jgi:hypothetical protein
MSTRTLTVMPNPRRRAAVQTNRVVLYARVSSKDQETEGFSIPAQLRLLRDYAASNDFAIAEEFTDVETAKASGRTNFGQMLAYLQKHPRECCTILVEKTDRLYRNLTDYATLDGLGVTIHLVKERPILEVLGAVHSRNQGFGGTQLQSEPWGRDGQRNDGKGAGRYLP